MSGPCTVPGCDRPLKVYGICNGHLAQARAGCTKFKPLRPTRAYARMQVPCGACGGRTAARHSRPNSTDLYHRACACGRTSLFRRVNGDLVFVRLARTPEEMRKYGPDRQFPGCGRPRRDNVAWCYGHDKQKDRGQPMRPLLPSNPRDRMREYWRRRRTVTA